MVEENIKLLSDLIDLTTNIVSKNRMGTILGLLAGQCYTMSASSEGKEKDLYIKLHRELHTLSEECHLTILR
jgi:hypothetical protein